MEVPGVAYDEFTDDQRIEFIRAIREEIFKEGIVRTFTKGNICKSDTIFGDVKADVVALKGPFF